MAKNVMSKTPRYYYYTITVFETTRMPNLKKALPWYYIKNYGIMWKTTTVSTVAKYSWYHVENS